MSMKKVVVVIDDKDEPLDDSDRRQLTSDFEMLGIDVISLDIYNLEESDVPNL